MTDAVGAVWETKYATAPGNFRQYPNEELVRFLGRTYWKSVPPTERRRLRALEVGCGNGANLWAIAREGMTAYGLDISPTAVGQARATLARWGVQAGLGVADGRALPVRTRSVDLVVDVGTLSCLTFTDLRRAYAEVRRVLRPGGRFFSYHFGRESWDYDHGGGSLIDRRTFDNMSSPEAIFPNLGTISMLAPADAEELLRDTGFTGAAIETVARTYANRTKPMQYLVITAVAPPAPDAHGHP